MARPILTTERLIAVLGVAVLALGAVVLWVATHGGGFGMGGESAPDRVRRQVREQLGSTSEVRYTEAGSGRVICGYAGRRGEAGAVAFVSRPNRIMLASDPLKGEFDAMLAGACPGFSRRTPPGPAA